MMKKALLALLIALLGVATANAEDRKVTVSAEDAGKPLVFPAPKAGEKLTIEVLVPVPFFRKATPAAPTRLVVVEEKSDTSLRGGVGLSYFLDLPKGGFAYTADLVGQVGFKSSPWRIRARAGLGVGRYDTMAISGSLAIMHVVPQFGVGIGVDGLTTIDQKAHPRETVEEQFLGASFRTSYEHRDFMLEWVVFSAGMHGSRVPGDTPQEFAFVTNASLTYLWGR